MKRSTLALDARGARPLGELEAAVMQRLWSWGRPAAVREVRDDLANERVLAYTTVMTVLDNLHSKELVVRVKQGRAFVYSPRLTREEHTAGLLEQVLESGGDRGATLLHFVGQMGADEVCALRKALIALEGRTKAFEQSARTGGTT